MNCNLGSPRISTCTLLSFKDSGGSQQSLVNVSPAAANKSCLNFEKFEKQLHQVRPHRDGTLVSVICIPKLAPIEKRFSSI